MAECEKCGRTFKKESHLKKHLSMQKTECKKSYDCQCGKSFPTKARLYWHCETCVYDYEDNI